MSVTLLISVVLRLAAAVWCVVLLRRLRDWSIALLLVILLLSSARPLLALLEQSGAFTFRLGNEATELPGFIISVLAFVAVAFFARHITARQRAQEAERSTARFYASLLDNASDMVQVLGRDGTMRYVSPSVERLLGHKPRELVGKSVFRMVHEQDKEVLGNAITRARDGIDAGTVTELRFRHGDGSWRVFESVATSLLEDPLVGGIVFNSLDVTERRKAETALRRSYERLSQSQKLELINTLAAGVVHDFKNVLTAISGYTQLTLTDLERDSSGQHHLEEVLAAVNRGERLADQILAFGRQDASKRKAVDLVPVVADVLRMIRPVIPPSIQIHQQLHATDMILVNATQIQQVVMNLCSNAAHAMRHSRGLMEVTLNAAVVDQSLALRLGGISPGPCLRLSVRDSGSGIAADVLPHVFEPLFTTRANTGGTGMGLAVAHRIVRAHGGGIAVESNPGHGTTFHVYLPQAIHNGTASVSEPQRLAQV